MFYGIIKLKQLLFSLMKQNEIKQTLKQINVARKSFSSHHGITFKALATFDTIFVYLIRVKLREIKTQEPFCFIPVL